MKDFGVGLAAKSSHLGHFGLPMALFFAAGCRVAVGVMETVAPQPQIKSRRGGKVYLSDKSYDQTFYMTLARNPKQCFIMAEERGFRESHRRDICEASGGVQQASGKPLGGIPPQVFPPSPKRLWLHFALHVYVFFDRV